MVTLEAANKVLIFRGSSENTPKNSPIKTFGLYPLPGMVLFATDEVLRGAAEVSAISLISGGVSAISLNFRPFLSHISNVSVVISDPS